MMYLTHGLSHCDAENRETGGCRVAESGVPFLNIGEKISWADPPLSVCRCSSAPPVPPFCHFNNPLLVATPTTAALLFH